MTPRGKFVLILKLAVALAVITALAFLLPPLKRGPCNGPVQSLFGDCLK